MASESYSGDVVGVDIYTHAKGHDTGRGHRSFEEIREELRSKIGGAAIVGVFRLNGHPLTSTPGSPETDGYIVFVNRRLEEPDFPKADQEVAAETP